MTWAMAIAVVALVFGIAGLVKAVRVDGRLVALQQQAARERHYVNRTSVYQQPRSLR